MTRSLLALVLITPSVAFADEPEHDPLKEGTWVTYYADMHVDSTDVEKKDSAKFTVRVLGSEVVDDEPCRWIELESPAVPESTRVAKLLVRESHLLGKSSGAPIVKGFVRVDDGPVGKFDANVTTHLQSELGLLIVASGKLTEAKTGKNARTIDYERGKLEVDRATTGRIVLPNTRFPVEYTIDYTTWPHEAVPLGVGAQKVVIRADLPDGGKYEMTIDLALQNFGTGATSKLETE